MRSARSSLKPVRERLERWLRRLHAPDEASRVEAARCLATPGLDISEAIPVLREALTDPHPHVRRLAGWVLARVGDESCYVAAATTTG